jgi:inhibitor of KinA sporulation pathway (predicted exonuclease)
VRSAWLRGHGLVDDEGARRGSWSFCTWSDADIGGQLATELRVKGLAMPSCFDRWVDLKLVYHRRYKREPRGGLQACVERLGLVFDGRAHNGLVDSINTGSATIGDIMVASVVIARWQRRIEASIAPPGCWVGRAADLGVGCYGD